METFPVILKIALFCDCVKHTCPLTDKTKVVLLFMCVLVCLFVCVFGWLVGVSLFQEQTYTVTLKNNPVLLNVRK